MRSLLLSLLSRPSSGDGFKRSRKEDIHRDSFEANAPAAMVHVAPTPVHQSPAPGEAKETCPSRHPRELKDEVMTVPAQC